MRVIIVDDEPKGIDLIKSYLSHFSDFELVQTFRNGLKALEFLNTNKIDLIFLDINMPHISGISLSKMIDVKTKIIFTTAYSEFAVESYEVKATDYLLKPISFERFTKAITKILSNQLLDHRMENSTTIMIKSGAKIFRVETKKILYLEKDGNYMTYHLDKQKILARETIAESLEVLPTYFVQIHKSFIVNTRVINYFNKDEISINDILIPIGHFYKGNLKNILK